MRRRAKALRPETASSDLQAAVIKLTDAVVSALDAIHEVRAALMMSASPDQLAANAKIDAPLKESLVTLQSALDSVTEWTDDA